MLTDVWRSEDHSCEVLTVEADSVNWNAQIPAPPKLELRLQKPKSHWMIQSSLFPGSLPEKKATFIRYLLTQYLTLIAQICSGMLAVHCWKTSLAKMSGFELCWCAQRPQGWEWITWVPHSFAWCQGWSILAESAFPLLHLHYCKNKRQEQMLPRQDGNPLANHFPLAFLINSDFWPMACSNRHKLLHLQDIQNTPNSKNFAFKAELGSIF